MTLLNHYTGSDRAIVVHDSLTTCAGRPVSWQMKPYIIPHAALLLMGRGPIDIQAKAFRELSTTFFAAGIDGASKLMPAILEGADCEVRELYSGELASEIALIGFSPRANAYRAIHFASRNGFVAEVQEPGVYLSPAPRDNARPGRLQAPTREMWIASAREQQRLLQAERAPGEWASVGGDLFMTELTKSGITITKLTRLPMYAEAVAEMQAGAVERRPAAEELLEAVRA